MRTDFARSLMILMLCMLLGACGSVATVTNTTAIPATEVPTSAPTSAPTAAPTATLTPTAAPTETVAPTATVQPTEAPTSMPEPTAAPARITALYQCEPGLCTYTQGDQEAEQLITALNPSLHGYSFMPDGSGYVYAQDAYASDGAEILHTNRELLDVRGVATIHGAPSGAGGLEGYGVVGVTGDSARVVFEDEAQLFIANLDGSERRALMDPRPYGASSTHAYALSPSGLHVLYTATGRPNMFEVINTDTQELRQFTLEPNRRAVALVDDEHVLVERFDPPFDPAGDNPAAMERFSLGYEVIPINGDTLGTPRVLVEDDGSFVRSVISNVVGEWVLISDDVAREDDMPEEPDPLWLLNVRTGTRQPVQLPLYDNYSRVAILIEL